MELLETAAVTTGFGVGSDSRGVVRVGGRGARQVTVLAREAWDLACADLAQSVQWTVRRANLLVEGLTLNAVTGARLRVGTVELLVTGETDPCSRMDAQVPGLREALTPDWRGGVTCRVVCGGEIAVGDTMTMDR